MEKKNSFERIITVVVGAVALFLAWHFWFGSGIFNGLFAKGVEDGKLGAGGADFFSQSLEILLTVLSTVGTVVIAIAFKLIKWISVAFEGITSKSQLAPASTSEDMQLNRLDTLTKQQFDDYCRVLIQSVVDGDSSLTIAMAERIHGSPFLRSKSKPSKTNENGFPSGSEQ